MDEQNSPLEHDHIDNMPENASFLKDYFLHSRLRKSAAILLSAVSLAAVGYAVDQELSHDLRSRTASSNFEHSNLISEQSLEHVFQIAGQRLQETSVSLHPGI